MPTFKLSPRTAVGNNKLAISCDTMHVITTVLLIAPLNFATQLHVSDSEHVKAWRNHFHDVIVGVCPDLSSPCKWSSCETNHVLCFCMTYTRQFLSEMYSWKRAILEAIVYVSTIL